MTRPASSGRLVGPAAIDEVQRAPELLLAIKERLDRDNTSGQFLLTGSTNIITMPQLADALPGRVDYRDQDRREVDIILEALDGSIVAIEVDAGATVRAADLRHLAWLRDARPDIFRQGILLHTGDRTRSWGDRLTSMPISALWT